MPTAVLGPEAGPRPISAEKKKVNDEPLRIVLTSLDQNVDAFAREAAHKELKKKEGGPFWKRMAKSAWKELSHESQVVKMTAQKRAEIFDPTKGNGNLLHHQGKSDKEMRQAVVERYGSEYGEHLIHEGETYHNLNKAESEGNEGVKQIRQDLQEILRDIAMGRVVDDESAQMMLNEKVQGWKESKISQQFIGEGNMLASNVIARGRELEGMVKSAEGLSELDKELMVEAQLAKMEIVAGEARVGSREEIKSTLSERVAEKLRGVPFLNEGRIAAVTSAVANEATIAAVMSVGIYAAKRGASLAGKVIAPGIGAGVVAAIKERNRLRDDRKLEARRADAGEAAPEAPDDSELSRGRKLLKKVGIGKSEDEYRAEVAATLYEAKPVEELLDDLGKFYNDSGELNIQKPEDFEAAMKAIGQVRARIQLGDRTDARLISFAGTEPEKMEARRFDLDLAMAKLETDMKKLVDNPVARGMLDIPLEDGKTPDQKFEELFAAQRNIAEGQIMGEMKAKDRLFNKLVAKQAFKRALMTTFAGAAIGGAVKYGTDAAREAFSAIKGTFDSPAFTNGPSMKLASFETNSDGSSIPGHAGSAVPEHGGSSVPTHGGTSVPEHAGTNIPGHAGTSVPEHAGTNASNAATPSRGGTSVPSHGGTSVPSHGGSDVPGHAGTDTPSHGGSSAPEHAGNAAPSHGGTAENLNNGEASRLTETSKLNMPHGYEAKVEGNGTVTITDPEGKSYSGLGLNKDGSLTQEAQNALREHGFIVQDHHEVVPGPPDVTHSEVTATQFVKNHPEMKTVSVTNFFVNKDLKHSDLNEFGLQNHFSSNGNITVDIRSMTANGSFNGNSGVNWHEAAKGGHIKLYVSASPGTQSHAFEYTFNTDGTLVIDKNDPAASLFKDGKFVGGFERVALNAGKLPNGHENVASLATEVGTHEEHIRDTIKTPTFKSVHTYTVRPTATPSSFVSTAPPPATGTPFVVPIPMARRRAEEDEPEPDTTSTTAGVTGGTTTPPAGDSSGVGATSTPEGGPEAGANTNTNAGNELDTGANSPNSGPNTANPDNGTNPNTSQNTGDNENSNTNADTNPDSSDANGPDNSANQQSANPEDAYFKSLDDEALDTPTGYDFAGWGKLGMRERKQAVRFINAATAELGDKDKAAVIARAQELAQAAATGSNGNMATLYGESLNILKQSAERVERDANKGPNASSYLENLSAETRDMPPFPRLNSYGANARKLAARIYWDMIAQNPRPANPTSSDLKSWYKSILRRAQGAAVAGQSDTNLTDAQKVQFGEAQAVLNGARNVLNKDSYWDAYFS